MTDDWFLYDPLWNGNLLSHTTHTPGNGWTVQESSIPASAFNIPGVNVLVVTSQTAEDPGPVVIRHGALTN